MKCKKCKKTQINLKHCPISACIGNHIYCVISSCFQIKTTGYNNSDLLCKMHAKKWETKGSYITFESWVKKIS